ncbi:protein dcd1A-like [Sycon ciliatum]|uniref:protein dcd1A-like n=1 Tax=Sycon ciliatum TaxID=27933 RepID=UPI0020AB7A6D|eukprot:scpid63407/ scgid19159/ Protein dcd1A; Acid ceramidase-like protein A
MAMRGLVSYWSVVASCLAVASVCNGAECHGKPNPNAKPNNNPIDVSEPVFVKSVPNGKLFTVGSGEDMFHVVHVYGDPYHMGYAHGQLMGSTAKNFMDDVWQYMEDQIEQAINQTVPYFHDWFLKDVANFGLDAALDAEILATDAFSGSYFAEEMKGLAAGCGSEFKKIQRIHMIGELTKGDCSMFGAWGRATASTNGGLLQLRALDWNVDGPFKNYPQVTVYHPPADGSLGHAFANIGWTGWVGSITGFSSVDMAMSEIGVTYPDDTFGKDSRFGVPFTYIIRDILQFDKTLEHAMQRINGSRRTCSLLLGIGDGKINQFRGVEYSASVANFFTDTNLEPTATWHPRINDTVYWGMDWLCPGYSQVLAERLQTFHGKLTSEVTIHQILPVVQTGDLHVAVYDLAKREVYVANARGGQETGPQYAYDRTFVRLDMETLFSEKAPTTSI